MCKFSVLVMALWALCIFETYGAERTVETAHGKLFGLHDATRSPDHQFLVFVDAKKITSLSNPILHQQRDVNTDLALVRAAYDGISAELGPLFAFLSAGTDARIVSLIASVGSPGALIEMSDETAEKMARDPRVQVVLADHEIQNVLATTEANPPSWGIDRIDQKNLPLDNSYTYNLTGSGVSVWVLDSGVRTTHTEFQGRASLDAVIGVSVPNDGDCNGHGTQVASIVGGYNLGVAKGVRIHAVDNVTCSGGSTYSAIENSLTYIEQNIVSPSVVNISQEWSVYSTTDPTLTAFQNQTAATMDAITGAGSHNIIVIAAGNDGNNTGAQTHWPAAYGNNQVLIVAASTSSDSVSTVSSLGSRVSLFAPGEGLTTAWNATDTAWNTTYNASGTGTSLAAPHVSGIVALKFAQNPLWYITWGNTSVDPNNEFTTPNVMSGNLHNAPNKLVNSIFNGGGGSGGGSGSGGSGGTTSAQKKAVIDVLQALLIQN